jgi:hypothetical protein
MFRRLLTAVLTLVALGPVATEVNAQKADKPKAPLYAYLYIETAIQGANNGTCNNWRMQLFDVEFNLGNLQYTYNNVQADCNGQLVFGPYATTNTDLIHMWIKGPKWLAFTDSIYGCGVCILTFTTPVMHAGDFDDSNWINIGDFNLYKNTQGKCHGDPGYDYRADVTGDDCATIADYSYFQQNYNESGPAPLW